MDRSSVSVVLSSYLYISINKFLRRCSSSRAHNSFFAQYCQAKQNIIQKIRTDSKVIKKGHILAKKVHFLCDISVFKEKKLFFLDFKRKSEKQTHFLHRLRPVQCAEGPLLQTPPLDMAIPFFLYLLEPPTFGKAFLTKLPY